MTSGGGGRANEEGVDDLLLVRRYPQWIEGIPSRSLMLEGAERLGVKLPTYTLAEVAKFFFAAHRQALHRLLNGVDRELWAEVPFVPPPLPPHATGHRYTLAEVERMIHGLALQERIRYHRIATALQLVAWTAKAFGVYA